MIKCPKCQHEGAYQGFNSYECPNRDCQNFTEKQFKAYLESLSSEFNLKDKTPKQEKADIDWESFNKLMDELQMSFPFGDDNDPICLKIPHTIFCYTNREDYIKHLEMINNKW